MIINRSGGTRVVLLVGRFVIKLPIAQFGIRAFLLGMASNLQEAKMSNFAEGLPKKSEIKELSDCIINVCRFLLDTIRHNKYNKPLIFNENVIINYLEDI